MAEPSAGVVVACNALRSDANTWAAAAVTVQGAAQAARGLVLGPDKLGVAAQQRGLVAAYESLRETVARVLTGGEAEFGKIATTLRQVADTYEHEDAIGAHRVAAAGENS